MHWNVEPYENADGKDLVTPFILDLPVADQRKVQKVISLLEMFGPNLKMPHASKMEGTDDLYELRTQGNNIQRVFYFHYDGDTFILLHAFTKKSQKTPQREIDTALRHRQDYLSRYPVRKED